MKRHHTMRYSLRVLVGMFLWLSPLPAWALDHDNLDKNRPVQLEDAYPIAKDEIALEGGGRFVDRRQGKTRFVFQPQVLYGAVYNTQLEIGGDLLTEPTRIEGAEKSGDLRLGALYNFNTETLSLPALALKLDLEFPTGVRSSGGVRSLAGFLPRCFRRSRGSLHATDTVGGAGPRRRRN